MHFWAFRIMWSCWLVFGLVWLAAAFRVKSVQQREAPRARMETVVAELLGYAALFWGPDLPGLDQRFIPVTPLCDAISLVAALAGLAIACWARAALAGNWSASITLKTDHELIRRGPYHWVRHPIYTGILLLVVANVATVGRWGSLVGLGLLSFAYWRKWRREERLMLAHFGQHYASYRKQTGAIVPGI